MLSRFLTFIEENSLLPNRAKILLAISGGVDSVVMAHLFQQLPSINFGLAHVNFQLRGKAADQDEAFVKALAQKWKVPFHVHRASTETYAMEHQLSIQMAAREIRYDWFREVMNAEGYQALCVAHHANDALETILFNLTKGTGIQGVTGLQARKDGIVRPLLFASKAEILEYAESKELEWREDQSNLSDKYARNLLRHQVVPVMHKLNPSLAEHFHLTWERLRGASDALAGMQEQLTAKYIQQKEKDWWISGKLFQEPVGIQRWFLAEWLGSFGFNYAQVRQLIGQYPLQAGKKFLSAAYILSMDRKGLWLASKEGEKSEEVYWFSQLPATVKLGDQQLSVIRHEQAPDFSQKPKEEEWLDADVLDFPFCVRLWAHGDRFKPLGMQQEKKLSDFMIDEKIPVKLKEQQWVLESSGKILAVLGRRISEEAKITSNSKSYIALKLEERAESI